MTSTTGYLSNLGFALSAVAPIFLVLAVGWVLRKVRMIDEPFVETASRLVFNVGLPSLIFVNLVTLDLNQVMMPHQLAYGLAATVAAFLLLWLASGYFVRDAADRGVVVQGAFRGNLGIIGIALCAQLYGQSGLAMGSMLLAVLTFSYNVLSVFALSAAGSTGGLPWAQILRSIVRNPLILSIVAGVIVAAIGWRPPEILLTSGHYFGAMTLPLALVCVGASLSSASLRHGSGLALVSVSLKLLWLPVLMTAGAVLLGFRGEPLGTLFAMFAAPTATVSYVMARAMGGNATLAASLVALSTLLSPLTLSLGIYALRYWQLI